MILARHAEENVIAKYRSLIGVKDRKEFPKRKLHIMVIRINSNNELTESKPCGHCLEVMQSYGIRKVTYSTRQGIMVTESLINIPKEASAGYNAVQSSINILDDMLKFYNSAIE